MEFRLRHEPGELRAECPNSVAMPDSAPLMDGRSPLLVLLLFKLREDGREEIRHRDLELFGDQPQKRSADPLLAGLEAADALDGHFQNGRKIRSGEAERHPPLADARADVAIDNSHGNGMRAYILY